MERECFELLKTDFAHYTIDYLNELLELDREGISLMIETRVQVNDNIVNHPTFPVQFVPEMNENIAGPLGLLNGLLGTDHNGHSQIIANVCPVTRLVESFVHISELSDEQKASLYGSTSI